MSGGQAGHSGSRGTKISYPTLEQARSAAWRRTVELGRPMYAYRCKLRDRPEHFHIAPAGGWNHRVMARYQERLGGELGERATACLAVENNGSAGERRAHLAKRLAVVAKRRRWSVRDAAAYSALA